MDKLREKVVNLYERVQKIPYYCLEKRDPDNLLEINKGCCLEKNVFLGGRYEDLGIAVKYLSIKFDWKSLPIPEKIVAKRDSSIGEHLALKIKLNQEWLIVDSTWDPGLEKAGFPVTKNWNGKNDTKLAVKALKISKLRKRPSKQVVKTNSEFFSLLNKYLERTRKS